MVHEYDASASNYLAEVAREDLIKIRANEVIELANGNPIFHEQRKQRVKELNPQEKKAVYDFLIKEVDKCRTEKNLVQIVEGGAGAKNLEYRINLYNELIARIERGAEYLKSYPDFPF